MPMPLGSPFSPPVCNLISSALKSLYYHVYKEIIMCTRNTVRPELDKLCNPKGLFYLMVRLVQQLPC